jgi:nicotinamide mononucleotide (NMN) deamidase PncC
VRSKKYQFSGDRYAIREQSIEIALKEMLQHASQ